MRGDEGRDCHHLLRTSEDQTTPRHLHQSHDLAHGEKDVVQGEVSVFVSRLVRMVIVVVLEDELAELEDRGYKRVRRLGRIPDEVHEGHLCG